MIDKVFSVDWVVDADSFEVVTCDDDVVAFVFFRVVDALFRMVFDAVPEDYVVCVGTEFVVVGIVDFFD